MTKRVLFEDEDVSEDDEISSLNDQSSLNVNKEFAKKYQERKQREDLSRLQSKYEKDYSDDDDSESDVMEDEDGGLLTPDVEAQIIKTISAIRAQDPSVYDTNKTFFQDLAPPSQNLNSSRSPLTLLDYQHELTAKGIASEDEEHIDKKLSLTEAQEQAKLKEEFKRAAKLDLEDEEALIVKKPKSKEELEREEQEYRQQLISTLSQDTQVSQTMPAWIDQRIDVDPNERFLIDFVLNRGWIDKSRRISSQRLSQHIDDPEELEKVLKEEQEDEEHLERTEELEFRHNFRFEQEGANSISIFPRNIEGSLRRPDTRRKENRALVKERKALEKQKELEQLKRLKNQRKRELLTKIERISGNNHASEELDNYVDDECDFDPQEHDRKMAALFNDEYYRQEDKELSSDEEQNIKIDEAPKLNEELKKALENAQNKASKNGKPVADLLEDLYQLDYEDKIEDVPCRFKYISSVPASSFGLDVSDILQNEDKALNGHMSMKKLAPYRPLDKQQHYIKKYSDKRRVWKFRHLLNDSSNK